MHYSSVYSKTYFWMKFEIKFEKNLFVGKKGQFSYLLEKKFGITFISLFVKMRICWFFGSIDLQYFIQGLQSWN